MNKIMQLNNILQPKWIINHAFGSANGAHIYSY